MANLIKIQDAQAMRNHILLNKCAVKLSIYFNDEKFQTSGASSNTQLYITNSSNIQDGTLGRSKKNDFINCHDLSFNLLICKSWEWITCFESEQYSPTHRGKNGKELVKLETAMN